MRVERAAGDRGAVSPLETDAGEDGAHHETACVARAERVVQVRADERGSLHIAAA
jgi:hypothetical protein